MAVMEIYGVGSFCSQIIITFRGWDTWNICPSPGVLSPLRIHTGLLLDIFLRFWGIDYDGDEQAAAKLDAYVRQVQRILARYEGALLQLTIGDKGSYLYAAFGAPLAHEDDAARAVSAALDLQALASTLEFIVDTRIGISQGRMRTGAYGGTMRRTYGVLGDEVNLAARLMQAAAPGQILLSQRTFSKVNEDIPVEKIGTIEVKGIHHPVSTYCVIAD